jgi:hypothetical protein
MRVMTVAAHFADETLGTVWGGVPQATYREFCAAGSKGYRSHGQY